MSNWCIHHGFFDRKLTDCPKCPTDEAKSPIPMLEEALRLVHGPRQASYGSPLDNWDRTAKVMSVILGIPISAEKAALCMIGVKLAREVHKHARDNLVDIAGYIGVIDLITQERKQRAAQGSNPSTVS